VHCLGFGCHHQAVKTFNELKLWNDMIFVDVPKHRHFV
jgi:superfamily I DNA and RNA helicase